jgi:hypothetical protein
MVLLAMVQPLPPSWLTTPSLLLLPGPPKFWMVRFVMVTPDAPWVKAYRLTAWPSITAPGAPTKVLLSAGAIWLNAPVPKVCVPGANQNVLPAWLKLTAELSPAATVMAPTGAVAGPASSAELPHTVVGAVGRPVGVVLDGDGVGVGAAAEGLGDAALVLGSGVDGWSLMVRASRFTVFAWGENAMSSAPSLTGAEKVTTCTFACVAAVAAGIVARTALSAQTLTATSWAGRT